MLFIAPLNDMPMFYIKYLTMHKVHMHAGANGCAYVREIIHSIKLVDYLPVHTHKPYNNLHLNLYYINYSAGHYTVKTYISMGKDEI